MSGTESEGFEPETTRPSPHQQETGSTPQGVTRWRKKPVEVDMIRWDGSAEALRLIRQHGGQPERLPDSSVNIWVEASDAEMNLDLGDWAALELDSSGVYPLRDSDHARGYEPADSEVKVGEVRALLARAGVERADIAHYVIATALAGGALNILTCCDGVDDMAGLLREALRALDSGIVPDAVISNRVLVRGDDLRVILEHVTPGAFSPAAREALDRLSAVAEVTR